MLMIFFFFFHVKNVSTFVDYMNKQHRLMKFISETEQNNTLFLDIYITHQNNQLKASVNRKPTFTSVFTYFESYIDQSYKKSVIFTLLSCCYFICLD